MKSPELVQVQGAVINVVQWLRLGVETTGALMVALGVLIALRQFLSLMLSRRPADFNAIRLVLARYLALALEFQLGADILSTAVDPSLKEITQLGAIAIIRTALNFFLSREMSEEQSQASAEKTVSQRAQAS